MILDKNGDPIKQEPKWMPYEHWRQEKLYFRAKEWFWFTHGTSYNPTQEEIENLMNNPDFIKDTFS